MRFLADMGVAIPIVEELRRQGHDALHLRDEGLQRSPDQQILYLINAVTLPGHRGNIDHVLVGPCGVVIIETKHYRGVIKCDRDQWFVNGRRIKSISRQAGRGAMAVKEWLSGRSAAFRTSRAKWVESVVVRSPQPL